MIDLNQFTRCVHCSASVPKGIFCVQCERPLLQTCPVERGELVVPLLSDSGRPTARCPQCNIPFKTCPNCRRLYASAEVRCAMDGVLLAPTTALDDGEKGGSPRNPARVWYLSGLGEVTMSSLPPASGNVERAAYAAERLVLTTQSAVAGRHLFSMSLTNGQHSRREEQVISGAAPVELRDSLTLSGKYIGVLNTMSASLYDNAPLQLRQEIPLPATPFAQVFTPTHWWLLTTAAGGMTQIHCYDLRARQTTLIPTQTTAQSVFQALSLKGSVVIASQDGRCEAFHPDGSSRFVPLASDSRLFGVAATAEAVFLLSLSGDHLYFYRWDGDSSMEQIGFVSAPERSLSGLIATPQGCYFYGARSLYTYRFEEDELLAETLPAAAEIMLTNVVTLGDVEHLFARQHTGRDARWEIWTPTVTGSRRSIGIPFSTRAFSGLTDTGYYLTVPSANVTGGSNQCEMRLWQFG